MHAPKRPHQPPPGPPPDSSESSWRRCTRMEVEVPWALAGGWSATLWLGGSVDDDSAGIAAPLRCPLARTGPLQPPSAVRQLHQLPHQQRPVLPWLCPARDDNVPDMLLSLTGRHGISVAAGVRDDAARPTERDMRCGAARRRGGGKAEKNCRPHAARTAMHRHLASPPTTQSLVQRRPPAVFGRWTSRAASGPAACRPPAEVDGARSRSKVEPLPITEARKSPESPRKPRRTGSASQPGQPGQPQCERQCEQHRGRNWMEVDGGPSSGSGCTVWHTGSRPRRQVPPWPRSPVLPSHLVCAPGHKTCARTDL